MATVTLGGNPAQTSGNLPAVNETAPSFTLVKTDLTETSLADYRGKNIVLNIFPSIDTEVCAMSVREFNEKAAALDNTVVLSISRDLPFAHKRFCAAKDIENAINLSTFRDESFARDYGVLLTDGPFQGLNARSVVVINQEGKVVYTELISEIANEPNYKEALAAVK